MTECRFRLRRLWLDRSIRFKKCRFWFLLFFFLRIVWILLFLTSQLRIQGFDNITVLQLIVILENCRCYSASAKRKTLSFKIFYNVFLRFGNNLSVNIFLSFFSFLFFLINFIVQIKLQIFGPFKSVGWSYGKERWGLFLFFYGVKVIINSNGPGSGPDMTNSPSGGGRLGFLRLIRGYGSVADVNILDG